MPSSRAVLADLVAAGLDPTKAHRSLRGGRLQTPDGGSKRKKGKEKPAVVEVEVVKPVDPPMPVVEPEPVVAPNEVPKSVGPALVFLEEPKQEVVAPVDQKQADEPAKVDDQADDKVEKKAKKQAKQSS